MSEWPLLDGKRVLFVLCGFDLGGAERQAMHLARYLKDQGCDVRLWGHHHHHAGPEAVIEACRSAGVPWSVQKFRWPCGKRALLCDTWGLLGALRRDRPDVILPFTTWPNIGCNLVWRWSPATICLWAQRDIVPLRGDRIERFAYRRASAIVCNAHHEIDHLQRVFGERADAVQVVHNGIDLPPSVKSRAEWRKDLEIGEDALVVTMLAHFRGDKDHATLLQAWRKLRDQLPDVPERVLVLAGAHQETYANVRELARGLAVMDTVRFPGHVGDVAGLLAASDVGVLCSRAEGLPNAVLEYMAGGLPVVATDVAGNREALGEASGHPLFNPGDADGLAVRLRELLGQPGLRDPLGGLNRERARAAFSVESMCRKWASLISEQLGAGGEAVTA